MSDRTEPGFGERSSPVELQGSPDDAGAAAGAGITRATLLARAGAGLAAGALGVTAPAALAKPARRPPRRRRLTPRRAAREIRQVVGGAKGFDPRDPKARIWGAHRLLADRRRNSSRGRATIELLERQSPPAGVEAPAALGSIPQDRISAAKFWWGYSVYFPHDPLVNVVVKLITDREFTQLVNLLQLALTAVELGWVVTALKAYVIGEIDLLVYLDHENDNHGAKLNATWPYPLVYVPTKM